MLPFVQIFFAEADPTFYRGESVFYLKNELKLKKFAIEMKPKNDEQKLTTLSFNWDKVVVDLFDK